jgi:hypothetical protein
MPLKGKYYGEFMAHYKRKGAGGVHGITKFVVFTKI